MTGQSDWDHNRVFRLLRSVKSAFRRLKLRGDDRSLPHEVRAAVISYENGEFDGALAFMKSEARENRLAGDDLAKELEVFLRERNVQISTSGYDGLQIRDLEPGGAPIYCAGIEDLRDKNKEQGELDIYVITKDLPDHGQFEIVGWSLDQGHAQRLALELEWKDYNADAERAKEYKTLTPASGFRVLSPDERDYRKYNVLPVTMIR